VVVGATTAAAVSAGLELGKPRARLWEECYRYFILVLDSQKDVCEKMYVSIRKMMIHTYGIDDLMLNREKRVYSQNSHHLHLFEGCS